MASPSLLETVWLDKYKYDDAEKQYYEHVSNPTKTAAGNPASTSSLVGEIARARQHIKHSLQSGDNLQVSQESSSSDTEKRLQRLEKENTEMKNIIKKLEGQVSRLESHVKSLTENKPQVTVNHNDISAAPKTMVNSKPIKNEVDDDDDIDLFGSDDDAADDEANKLREKRLEEYSAKKSKKPQLIAKSSVVLDIKPWDDETDMADMEKRVRAITMDGLLWGASKLVPLAYGIKKLQIVSVVEDDKVSIEELQEAIEAFEDLVQSVDIAAFNKI